MLQLKEKTLLIPILILIRHEPRIDNEWQTGCDYHETASHAGQKGLQIEKLVPMIITKQTDPLVGQALGFGLCKSKDYDVCNVNVYKELLFC